MHTGIRDDLRMHTGTVHLTITIRVQGLFCPRTRIVMKKIPIYILWLIPHYPHMHFGMNSYPCMHKGIHCMHEGIDRRTIPKRIWG